MATVNTSSPISHTGGKVLMIACAFPPTGGPGVQRSAKFAKYLPQSNWYPTVWTSDQMDSLPRDPSLLEELPPEVTIHTYSAGGRIKAMRKKISCAMNAREGEGFSSVASRFVKALDWRLGARQNSTTLPDEYITWARRSIRPLLRLIENESIDIIYSTLSPASNHSLALELKRQTQLPWVADFRDLWTDDYRYRESSIKRQNAHRELEREILETADVVIGVTERQTAILSGHVPTLKQKFVTITNGYDPDDFEAIDPQTKTSANRFVLSHVGRFDKWRTHDSLFAAFKQYTSSLGTDREHFLLRIVGHASQSVLHRLHQTGLPYEFTGYQSHAQAIEVMQNSDGLLLNVPDGPNSESVIPAKLFEYLATHKPILVVGPEHGECEKIVQSCNAGLTVHFDTMEIANAMGQLYTAWKNNKPLTGCDENALPPFNRSHLTQRLSNIFNELVHGPTVTPTSTSQEESLEALVT